jgi:hypothetical protein
MLNASDLHVSVKSEICVLFIPQTTMRKDPSRPPLGRTGRRIIRVGNALLKLGGAVTTIDPWTLLASVLIGALILYVVCKAIIGTYFKAKESFVDKMVNKLKGASNGKG